MFLGTIGQSKLKTKTTNWKQCDKQSQLLTLIFMTVVHDYANSQGNNQIYDMAHWSELIFQSCQTK